MKVTTFLAHGPEVMLRGVPVRAERPVHGTPAHEYARQLHSQLQSLGSKFDVFQQVTGN